MAAARRIQRGLCRADAIARMGQFLGRHRAVGGRRLAALIVGLGQRQLHLRLLHLSAGADGARERAIHGAGCACQIGFRCSHIHIHHRGIHRHQKLAALAYGAYWYLDARFYESTDDAYVSGDIVAVTSRENATLVALHADNTQTVTRGQLLMEMDLAVVNVNVASAEANLARTIRTVNGEFSRAVSSSAQVEQAQVQLSLAQ